MGGALTVAEAGVRTGGDARNRDFVSDAVELDGLPEPLAILGFDPQTSGGLLVSLPKDKAAVAEAELAARDLFVRRVGSVETGGGVSVG